MLASYSPPGKIVRPLELSAPVLGVFQWSNTYSLSFYHPQYLLLQENVSNSIHSSSLGTCQPHGHAP